MGTSNLPSTSQRRAWLGPRLGVLLLCLAGSSVAQTFQFQESSQPEGIIASQTNNVAAGSTVQTAIAPLTSSSYGFAYWLTNGQPAKAASGQSLVRVSIVVNSDTTAVAVYLPVSQSTNGSGIPDYQGLYYYGSTTNAASSDTDGDGISFSEELARGYDPTIPDVAPNGGAIMRLSDLATYVPGPLYYYYQIQSDPLGVFPSTSGYLLAGMTIQTPDVAYGQSEGYYFIGWSLNGLRQAGVTGAALNEITLVMTNDQIATAAFVPPSQTAGGLPNWYDLYWFGTTNDTINSDPRNDGFAIGDDILRGYCPTIANVTTNGGPLLRLSDSASYVPVSIPPLPCPMCVGIYIVNGMIELAWAPGGILQSAPGINGIYTDVPHASDPYFISPSGGSLFFRVRFP